MRLSLLCLGMLFGWSYAQPAVVWKQAAQAELIVPDLAGPTAHIVENTINQYTGDKFGWKLPVSRAPGPKKLSIVAGSATNNPLIAKLGREGVDIRTEDLGEEGFRIVTYQKKSQQYVVLLAQTPAGLKFAAQELVFFHMPATKDLVSVDWPMDLRKKPQFAYRGIYMLPCWAQHDSVEHWRRVLRFNSELTCNRNYFWLDGFPLLPQYGGEYTGTDLAQPSNVRSLIELSQQLGVKFLIGGGWDTWHQRKLFGNDVMRSVQYYLDLFHLLPGSAGIYLEPVGEGSERTDPAESLKSVAAIRKLAETIWRERPDFEFAVAAGKFNPKVYLDALDAIDRKRIYWTWGWGDPTRDHALAEHPLVLRWHTIVKMSEWHGSNDAPRPDEIPLPGFYTSYDPGMGFGNTWNGRGYGVGTGISAPREFDPYTIPYFAHEYWFRERAWDVHATREQFSSRLARRLFDADMPADAIVHYLALQEMCHTPKNATDEFLIPIERFTTQFAQFGTPRNQDTIRRMQEAIAGFRKVRFEPEKKKKSSTGA
jgi:hypothetical protein